MKVVVALLVACVGVGRPAISAANDTDEIIREATYGAFTGALIASTAASIKFARDDLGDRELSRTDAALELGVSELGLAIGTTVFALGHERYAAYPERLGIVIMAVTLPTTLHGGWSLATRADESDDDRRHAGLIELAFAVPQAAAAGIAVAGFAADPNERVRTIGVTTSLVLLAPSLAMMAHGAYLAATSGPRPPPRTTAFARPRRGDARFTVAPVLVGSNVGLGVAGAF